MVNHDLFVVQLKNINKQYPGGKVKANNSINLSLKKGEILCIAGENGAGKTTLMKILNGIETPDTGEIYINGKKELIKTPLAAKKLGIGMVHQHFRLFPEFTVAENIAMGNEPRKWGVFFDFKKSVETADRIINENNFNIKSSEKVRQLTPGQAQQAEICRILSTDARIIILDEPTSILTEKETESLFAAIKNLALKGKSIIFITHKIHEIKAVCGRVVVMRHGAVTGSLNIEETDENEIARLITGDSILGVNKRRCHEEKSNSKEEPVIAFKNVSVYRRRQKLPLLDNVSFDVSSGEILGITGVGGNGLGVIEAVLGGFLHPANGNVYYKGKDISKYSIQDLRKGGLGFVPADRLTVGSAGEAAIEENIIINRRYDFTKRIFINKKAVKNFYNEKASEYNMDNKNGNEKCAVLSGGNLQKLVLAREIDCFKDYIVFSEPSRGLDIASTQYIRERIENLKNNGAAVVLISTDIDEIMELSDNIIVMYKGKAMEKIINTKERSVKERIGRLIQGTL